MAWTGTGTNVDPYQIYTIDDLIATTGSSDNTVHSWYILMNDLDVDSVNPWIPLMTSYFPISYWNCSLDGNNKTISNLHFTTQSIVTIDIFNGYGACGLIAQSLSTGSSYIKDLNIISSSVDFNVLSSDTSYTSVNSGILVGISTYTNISNVHISKYSCSININDTFSANALEFASFGRFENSTLISSSVESSSIYVYSENDNITGVTTCFATSFCNAQSTHSYNYVKGCKLEYNGLYTDLNPNENFYTSIYNGVNYGKINDCYVYNNIITSSNNDVCGFVTEGGIDDISNVYSYTNFGNTPSQFVHSFYIYAGNNFTNCHYESGSYSSDHLQGAVGMTGSLAINLQNQATFTDWDFANIWLISPSANDGYPYLGYESVPGPGPDTTLYAILEYSTNSGSTWHEITSSIPLMEGDNIYNWNAPMTASSQYLIRITTSSLTDSSNIFTIAEPYTIAGTISPYNAENISGVSMSFNNGGGVSITDGLGNYISNTFTSSYTGILTPFKYNNAFIPVTRSYENITSSLSNQNFIISESIAPITYYSISGSTMVSGTTTPISGAKVQFSIYLGSKPTIKYSDVNGIYSASFIQNVSASIFATHPFYTMVPTYKTISNLTNNLVEQVFSGSLITYVISGSITSASIGVPGIEVLCSPYTTSLFTDSNGKFSGSFETGSSITLTPSSLSYIFSPTNVQISNISASSYNNDFIASSFIAPGSGLSLHYDSRKSYDSASNIWPDLSSELPDLNMNTYNTYYTDNKDLLFGAEWIGPASSSFYGTQVSSSFAIEMWIGPSTASAIKTILSTEGGDYPSVVGYISQSKFVVEYKNNISEINTTKVKTYNIAESKYNHIVLFSSASYLYAWSNGICYESASITQSNWNGATLGINREFNTSSYEGFIDVVKVWNGIQISLPEITNYYVSRSYWKDFGTVNIPIVEP